MYECSNFSVSSLRLVIFCLKITIIIISILLGVKWSLIFKSEYFRWCNGKESACQCRRCKRHSFNLWIGKLPSKRKYILQYSCLENSKDRGAWQATVHGVAKSQARLTDWITTVSTPWVTSVGWWRLWILCQAGSSPEGQSAPWVTSGGLMAALDPVCVCALRQLCPALLRPHEL